jgi:hypothetical protein
MSYPKTSDLERELVAHLRENASGNARAMAATVVVVSEAVRAEAADAVVDRLMGRRPARVLHLRGFADEGYKSWSAARCSLDRQSRGVCFEDIYLESPDDSAYESRIWAPFVVRELPALLFWNLGPKLLSSCDFDCADRVDLTFVDGSSDIPYFGTAIDSYASASFAAIEGTAGFADLAWERALPVRLAASRLFDGGRGADLDAIKEVRIRSVDAWSAALMRGWIVSRLGKRAKGVSFDSAAGNEPVSVTFALQGHRQASAVFRDAKRAHLDFADGTEIEVSFPAPDDGLSLARLVDAPLVDPLFVETLRSLVSA